MPRPKQPRTICRQDVPDFQKFLEVLFHKHGVRYNPHGIVVLSSRERDSFAKLFGNSRKTDENVRQPLT